MATNDLSTEKRPIPSWAEVYQPGTLASQQRQAEQQAAQIANPPAWALQMLPRDDPRALRARWEIINPGVPYPEDGQ